MTELIDKKRDGGELTASEIEFMVSGYTAGSIPDYQMSALLMAVYFRGMSDAETLALTMAMARSGDTLDLSGTPGPKADKHSTGGVGDKTTLVLCPMVACLGIKMAKMSGRGLGYTGGTIDKLESFGGFSPNLTLPEFLACINKVGFAISGQTANLTPADKKLYALRDVTGLVASKPLIVSSVMSKKLAMGTDIIVLDVKTGSGSFMKTEKEAFGLAEAMVRIGRLAGKRTAALITDMDEPLGNAVGNALEVREAISVLRGRRRGEVRELCLALGAAIALQSGLYHSEEAARAALADALDSGAALRKFTEFVEVQGGNRRAVSNVSLLPRAPYVHEAVSPSSGFVAGIAADEVGRICLRLGAGRATKESAIDLGAGVVLRKKRGDAVTKGEPLAQIHAPTRESALEAAGALRACYSFSPEKPEKSALIKGIIQ